MCVVYVVFDPIYGSVAYKKEWNGEKSEKSEKSEMVKRVKKWRSLSEVETKVWWGCERVYLSVFVVSLFLEANIGCFVEMSKFWCSYVGIKGTKKQVF